MALNKTNAQAIIKEQNEKIARLEKAFRDVTGAYKTLLSEKETLQASVKLLTSEKNDSTSTPGGAGDESGLDALKQNMQALIDSKAKLEANFQVERRTLKTEYDDLKQKLERFKQESAEGREELEATMNELRASLKMVQAEREKLVQENAFIMKELKKAKIDEKLNEETNIRVDQTSLDNLQAEYKELVDRLRKENNELKSRVKLLNEKLSSPSEDVLRLEKEVFRLKELYEKRILEDANRMMLADLNLKETVEKNEKRTAALESELTELYKVITKYENAKKTNSETRKSTSSENQLFMSLPNSIISHEDQSHQHNDEVDKAIQKIYELKRFIQKNDKDFKFDDILSPLSKSRQNGSADEFLHEKCKEEQRLLKDEFERYKSRMNQLMKAKYNKELLTSPDSNSQQQLKEEISYLKNRMNSVENTKMIDSKKQEDKIRSLEDQIDNLKMEHRYELEKLEKKYSVNVNDLEKQSTKQRERTLKLLNEKDTEIERLRSNYSSKKSISSSEAVAIGAASSSISDSEQETTQQVEQQQQSAKTTTTNSNEDTNLFKLNPNLNETTLLHYSQEIAFKDAEISKLRKIKTDLEYRVKQILSDSEMDVENYKKQISLLKQEIERLKLNTTRVDASANMEYIKNVVFRFLIAKEVNVKLNMINAIAQILQFTKQEKAKAIAANS